MCIAQQITGPGVQLIVNAISPSLMPFEVLDETQCFPTSFLVSLFGEEEDWLVRGEEVGAALLRHLKLKGSMHTERAVRAAIDWLCAHHPDATDARVEAADHRGMTIVLRIDYPPKFLHGILQRIAWETRAKDVTALEDDPYRFHIRL